MRKKNLLTLFLREKPAKSLLLLRKADGPLYASVIAKAIDSTHAHTLSILSRFADFELISSEEVGRIKLVKLTEVGAWVADVLETFSDMETLVEVNRKTTRLREEIEVRPKRIDLEKVSRRLTRCKKELKRLAVQKPKLKEQAGALMKRIDQLLAGKRSG